MHDLIIIGAGASGLSCALVIGSGLEKSFASDKKVSLIAHQKTSHLESALFNNVLGLAPQTLGKEVLIKGKEQLTNTYPKINQINREKVYEIKQQESGFLIITNKNTYQSKLVVLALNYAKPFSIKGLDQYIIPHKRANASKNRIQLQNTDHLISTGLYACGTIAGWRSQFSIAAGSGAQVATDILTLWNNGMHTKVHDKA
jgi:hypothetical protein